MAKIYVQVPLFLLFSAAAVAQNLVPNPSFETFTVCPKELGKRQLYIDKWIQPTAGSIDYFHRCSQNCGVPQNVMGYQEPKSGDAYIGMTMYHDKYRVYAEIELKEPLLAGTNYKVEFAVCLSEKSKHAIGNIGAYFTTLRLESKVETVMETYENFEANGTAKLIPGLCKPQIKNSTSSFVSNDNEWTVISGTFKARGGEKFMTIGNFFSTAGTPVMTANGKSDFAYYFLDDVAVYQNGTKPEPFPRSTYVPEVGVQRNGTTITTAKLTAASNTNASATTTVSTSKTAGKSPGGASNTGSSNASSNAATTSAATTSVAATSAATPTKTIDVKKDPVKKVETQSEVKPTVLKHLYFEKNSSKILPESEDELTMLAEILGSDPDMVIEIAGHTDESGNEPANKQLSLARAQAVSNFMQMLDIESDRMICKGWGSFKPIADNKTEEGRIKNRRVEFTVVKK